MLIYLANPYYRLAIPTMVQYMLSLALYMHGLGRIELVPRGLGGGESPALCYIRAKGPTGQGQQAYAK